MPVPAGSAFALLSPRGNSIATISPWIATFVATSIMVPVLFLIGLILLGLTTGGGVVMGVLIPLLAFLIVPTFDAIVGVRRWRAAVGAVGSGGGPRTPPTVR